MHHFAVDENLPLPDYSLKKLNNHINRDLKPADEWVRANKLSPNLSKTEKNIFKPENKNMPKCLNFRISGQKIKLNKQVKYLGVILQDDLHWNSHLSNLEKKISPALGLLSKVRHYISKYLLRTIYYSLFNMSHLISACEIWGQNQNNTLFQRVSRSQEKALCIINFKLHDTPSDKLFKENKILKISDFIKYKNQHELHTMEHILLQRKQLKRGIKSKE